MAQSVGASATGLRCIERHRFELRPLPDTFYLLAYLFCPIVLHAGHGPMEVGRIRMKRLLTFLYAKKCIQLSACTVCLLASNRRRKSTFLQGKLRLTIKQTVDIKGTRQVIGLYTCDGENSTGIKVRRTKFKMK